MNEPLSLLFNKYGYDKEAIEEVVCGLKYTSVMLKNGNIGVCANLLREIKPDMEQPHIDSMDDRIFLNAYFNALLNYENTKEYENGDIFDLVNFKKYENIVMIGYFKPLYKKFLSQQIKLKVFDFLKNDDVLLNNSLQDKYLQKADALILSATTIFNKTFISIINKINDYTHVFVLGPSTICSPFMFKYKGIRALFGGIFNNNNRMIGQIIKNGGGTKEFLPYMKKISFFKEN